MIKSLRIDERLIHGQVAVTWCSALGISNIVVANDEAAADEVSRLSLKMAAPQKVKVAVKTVKDAITLLQDPRCERLKILILVKHPKDALAILESVENVPFVNVGNYGMLDKSIERRILSTSFAVSKEDIDLFKKIIALRDESNYQMTPTLQPQKLKNLINK